MKNNTKKWITVAGSLLICVVLAGAVGSQLKTEQTKDAMLPAENPETVAVTVETEIQTLQAKETVTVTMPETTVVETAESLPAQTDLPEQKIQPDPVKPKEPERPKTTDGKDRTPYTDKNHEFVAESSDVPPVYHAEETQIKPEESRAEESKNQETRPEESQPQKDPQGGDSTEGKIYAPGFGWIDDIGEGKGTVAEDMYENGNKIGVMD